MKPLQLRCCLGLSAVLLATGGCNSVGQGLVDRQPLGAGLPTGGLCKDPPMCSAKAAAPLVVIKELAATAVDLSQCDGNNAHPCAVSASDPNCASWEVESPAMAPKHPPLYCTELQVRAKDPKSAASAAWSDLSLKHSNMLIEATSPLVLELDNASLQDCFISLQGPVTLRISNSTGLNDLQFSGAVNVGGEPHLELEHSDGGGLVVGSGKQLFEGVVSIARSVFEQSQLHARDVQLQSVRWDRSLIDATNASLIDTKLALGVLSSEAAVISASNLLHLQVEDCGSLALIDTNTVESNFHACSLDALRVYGGLVNGGVIDGPVESDAAAWDSVLFGVEAASDLTVWSGSMETVQFCSQTHSLQLGAEVGVKCSACAAGTLKKTGSVCAVPNQPPQLDSNTCPALLKVDDCKDPLPVRQRPP